MPLLFHTLSFIQTSTENFLHFFWFLFCPNNISFLFYFPSIYTPVLFSFSFPLCLTPHPSRVLGCKCRWLKERDEEIRTCTAFRGTSPEVMAATTLITRAATLTVSWNWINFWIFAYTERPQRTTCTKNEIDSYTIIGWPIYWTPVSWWKNPLLK